MLHDKTATMANVAEAELFELQHDCNQKIVVRMERLDLRRRQTRRLKGTGACDAVSNRGDIGSLFGFEMINPFAVTDRMRQLLGPELPRPRRGGDHECARAVAHHNTVE